MDFSSFHVVEWSSLTPQSEGQGFEPAWREDNQAIN